MTTNASAFSKVVRLKQKLEPGKGKVGEGVAVGTASVGEDDREDETSDDRDALRDWCCWEGVREILGVGRSSSRSSTLGGRRISGKDRV